MAALFAPPQVTPLEQHVLRLGQPQRRIRCWAPAEQLPWYPWRLSFATPGLVQERSVREHVPHENRYEIRFLNPLHFTARKIRPSDHGVSHEEMQC
jgi:hypothetical protein